MIMTFSQLFGFSKKPDPTQGAVRRVVEARQKLERASELLTATLDKADSRADIVIKGFIDETRARRD